MEDMTFEEATGELTPPATGATPPPPVEPDLLDPTDPPGSPGSPDVFGPHGGWQAPPPPPPPTSPPPTSPPPTSPPPPPHSGEHRKVLRRAGHQRVLGGVAAGLADYLEIDPVIVRIAFVVLAVLAGSGVLLYVAAWLLIPAEDTGRAVVQDFMERRPRRRSLVAIVLGTIIGIIALSNLFSSGPWWRHWDGGFGGTGFFLGLCALMLAAVLVMRSGRREGSPLRWLLLTALVAVVAVAVVAAATVFSVEALSGVPLRGGIGDTQWRPTTVSQVAPKYRLAIGTMQVDLRDVPFKTGTTHVTASVGIGNLVVDVPPGASVSVAAHSGLGSVQVFGQNEGGFSMSQTKYVAGTASNAGAAPHIVLDAETGVGQVQVIRTGP